jgi:hypothetical protein
MLSRDDAHLLGGIWLKQIISAIKPSLMVLGVDNGDAVVKAPGNAQPDRAGGMRSVGGRTAPTSPKRLRESYRPVRKVLGQRIG